MKKWFAAAAAATVCLGSAWHFLYDWCPHFLVGLFAPVNESVWEHLKLLFWPVIPAALALGRRWGERRVWSAFLAALLAMPVALCAVYYLAAAGFGLHGLALDIGLYAGTVCAGFWAAFRWSSARRLERRLGELLMLAGLYGCALVLFTLEAPPLPIFMPPA